MSEMGAIQPCHTPLKNPEGLGFAASVGLGIQELISPMINTRISTRMKCLFLFIESLLESLEKAHFLILLHIVVTEPFAIHSDIDPWGQCLDISQGSTHIK